MLNYLNLNHFKIGVNVNDPSYVPLHIASGGLALRFGFKNFLMITSIFAAVLTIAFPLLIRTSYTYGLISRILLGAFHSGWFPAMQGAWGVWSPKEEMSQLLMTIFVGATIGVMTVTSLGGVIVEHYGWPSIFYGSGGLTLIWAVFWYFFVFDSPSEHPTISEEGMGLKVYHVTYTGRTFERS